MSCIQRSTSKIVNNIYHHRGPGQEMTCVDLTMTSPASPLDTPTSTFSKDDTSTASSGKRGHCKPPITSEDRELNNLLEEALTNK